MKTTHFDKLFLVESAGHDIPYVILSKYGTVIYRTNDAINTVKLAKNEQEGKTKSPRTWQALMPALE